MRWGKNVSGGLWRIKSDIITLLFNTWSFHYERIVVMLLKVTQFECQTTMSHFNMLISILHRRHAGLFFEQFREVKVGFEVERECNFFNRPGSVG